MCLVMDGHEEKEEETEDMVFDQESSGDFLSNPRYLFSNEEWTDLARSDLPRLFEWSSLLAMLCKPRMVSCKPREAQRWLPALSRIVDSIEGRWVGKEAPLYVRGGVECLLKGDGIPLTKFGILAQLCKKEIGECGYCERLYRELRRQDADPLPSKIQRTESQDGQPISKPLLSLYLRIIFKLKALQSEPFDGYLKEKFTEGLWNGHAFVGRTDVTEIQYSFPFSDDTRRRVNQSARQVRIGNSGSCGYMVWPERDARSDGIHNYFYGRRGMSELSICISSADPVFLPKRQVMRYLSTYMHTLDLGWKSIPSRDWRLYRSKVNLPVPESEVVLLCFDHEGRVTPRFIGSSQCIHTEAQFILNCQSLKRYYLLLERGVSNGMRLAETEEDVSRLPYSLYIFLPALALDSAGLPVNCLSRLLVGRNPGVVRGNFLLAWRSKPDVRTDDFEEQFPGFSIFERQRFA